MCLYSLKTNKAITRNVSLKPESILLVVEMTLKNKYFISCYDYNLLMFGTPDHEASWPHGRISVKKNNTYVCCSAGVITYTYTQTFNFRSRKWWRLQSVLFNKS